MIPTPLPAIPFGGSDLAISWGGKRRQYEPKEPLEWPPLTLANSRPRLNEKQMDSRLTPSLSYFYP